MIKILTTAQIREVEERANAGGISYLRLMENAGSACAKAIRKRFDNTDKRNVTVLCGKGKNGGDGFVVARRLRENGYAVRVLLVCGRPKAGDALEMFSRIRGMGISIEEYDARSAAHRNQILQSDILVDAVFGTGFSGAADDSLAALFTLVNTGSAYVVSIDLPSGLEADSGETGGKAVRADLTVAAIALKKALAYHPAAAYAGEVEVVPIGIPDSFFNACTGDYTLTLPDIRAKFPVRPENSSKSDFGKALVIAGSYEMPGAAVLASSAAVLSGAGLVQLAFPDRAYAAVTAQCPEKILLPLESNRFGRISAQSAARVKAALKKCSAVLIGCGLGADHDTQAVTELVLENAECPIVLDADGINVMSGNIHGIKEARGPVVLTPHPGEAARLLSSSAREVQADREGACAALFAETGAVVVLKGSRTLVTANGTDFYVNLTGSSALATAGTGDILAGLLLSFICQRMGPFSAAVSAVFIHGTAGDEAEKESSKMGVTASKLLKILPRLLKRFEA